MDVPCTSTSPSAANESLARHRVTSSKHSVQRYAERVGVSPASCTCTKTPPSAMYPSQSCQGWFNGRPGAAGKRSLSVQTVDSVSQSPCGAWRHSQALQIDRLGPCDHRVEQKVRYCCMASCISYAVGISVHTHHPKPRDHNAGYWDRNGPNILLATRHPAHHQMLVRIPYFMAPR